MKELNRREFLGLATAGLALAGCGKPGWKKIVDETQPGRDIAISADGVSISYALEGKGKPALVFIHGWSNNKSFWDAQVPYFKQNYMVITIDLPGFGESGNNRKDWTMKAFGKDVAAVIEKLNLKQVVLIGHSMGGPVILETAMLMPDCVLGLVPVDILKNVGTKYDQEKIKEIGDGFLDTITKRDAKKFRDMALTPTSDPALIERYFDETFSAPKIGWHESLEDYFNWVTNDCIPTLKNIQIPIYCINSDKESTNVKEAQKYAKSFKVEYMYNVGHFPHMEDPKTFNYHLENIVKEFVSLSSNKPNK